MAEIVLDSVQKRFGEFTAVRESSFTVRDGEFFVMLGPSGCGKTTTLRMIAGLELPSDGRILLDGEDVTWRRGAERDIAFVFQLFALYPHMSVRRNISFPLRIARLPGREIAARTEEVAALLQITHLLDRSVSGLAAGDRQRVALGRAIVRRAKAFLMDEPLGALDAAFREVMTEELRILHNRIGATTVYVTHDQVEAMAMADRICVMNHAEVLQIGTPDEIYARPSSRFVAGFIGSPAMNFLPLDGAIVRGETRAALAGGLVALPRVVASTGAALLGVRPEHVVLAHKGLPGRVVAAEYLGARVMLTVDTPAGALKVRTGNASRLAEGDTVALAFDPARVSVFDAATGASLTAGDPAHG